MALLLSWLPPKLAHLWDLKAPKDLTQSAFRVNFPSLFNEQFQSVYVYTSMCSHCDCDLSLAGGEYICFHCGRYRACCVRMLCGFLQCSVRQSNKEFYT